jgi:alpha-L-arabinofuranosidase
MKSFKATCLIIILSVTAVAAQPRSQIIIHTDSVIKQISPLLTGACIEDVNHEIYGGIYSQMIFGESFQEVPMRIDKSVNPKFDGLSGELSSKAPRDVLNDESEIRSWQPVKKGNAMGSFQVDSVKPFVGRQSQVMAFNSGAGVIGIENRGLNREGLSLAGNKEYEGIICARAAKMTLLYLALESEDGKVLYAETSLTINTNEWKKYDFKLTPTLSAAHARFAISLHQRGEAELGYVFLQPGLWGRYKDLPVRKDVAEGLLREKITVLRYGGSMVNANGYRWKNMIGLRYKRPPYHGTWYPFSSNGWGIIDFLNLCEALHIAAVPAFNSSETPANMADFMEYVNGDERTTWGKKRIADGHPSPYHLKYIELGNEQFNNDTLTAQFKLLADAIWKKDADIQLIFCVSDNTHEDLSGDLLNFKKTIDNARSSGRQAWFDAHIFNDNEKEPDLKDFEFAEKQLQTIAPDGDYRLCIFEENADNARMRRGLAHANAINRVIRLPYDIPILCAANGLQVDHQNDNGWDQGLLFFNQTGIWGQPSYYISQMVAENYLPVAIKSDFISKNDTLDISARKSADGRTITVQVVNRKPVAVTAQVILDKLQVHNLVITQLRGNSLDDWNTVDEPYRIMPLKRTAAAKGNTCNYSFAPYSFTILKFEKR